MITEFKTLLELTRYFSTEQLCRDYYEQIRWNGKPACPHCGSLAVYRFADGINFKCGEKECNQKFTVRIGTIFENSKVPLQKWFMAIWFLTSHKKGISSYQLGKDIGVTQKTAWYMAHRVREMLRIKQGDQLTQTVEADETYIGGKHSNKHKKQREILNKKGTGYVNKTPLFVMLERESGRIYNQVLRFDEVNGNGLKPIIYKYVKPGTALMTDNFGGYAGLKLDYQHAIVEHEKDQFVNGKTHTNTVEGFFSLLKRQIYGIHHFVTPKHLSRYCDEAGFRYETKEQKENERFYNSLTQAESYLPYKKLVGKV